MSYDCYEKMEELWVPELDYIFSSNISNCFTSTMSVPISSIVDKMFDKKDSVFNLLFSPVFIPDEYNYLFIAKDSNTLPNHIWERISPIDFLAKYWVSAKKGYNIFDFNDEDIMMFNHMLNYRKNNENLIYITYPELTKPLSKMIFIYLDLFINKNCSRVLELNNLRTTTVLDTMYKMYLISEAHQFISRTHFMIKSRITDIVPKRDIFEVVSEFDNIHLSKEPANCDIVVYLNGNILDKEYFSYNKNENCIEFNNITPTCRDSVIVDYWVVRGAECMND